MLSIIGSVASQLEEELLLFTNVQNVPWILHNGSVYYDNAIFMPLYSNATTVHKQDFSNYKTLEVYAQHDGSSSQSFKIEVVVGGIISSFILSNSIQKYTINISNINASSVNIRSTEEYSPNVSCKIRVVKAVK